MQRLGSALLLCVVLAAGQALAASKGLTGVELAQFNGRDVLVVRTTGDVAVPSGFQRDGAAAQVSFLLSDADSAKVAPSAAKLSSALVKHVAITSVADGALVTVTLAKGELADPAYFRLSSPSRHVILFEVFPLKEQRDQAAPLLDVDKWLGGAAPDKVAPAPAKPVGAKAPAVSKPVVSGSAFAQQVGIPSLDLSKADPQRVLGLAVDSGLLSLRGNATVSTEGWGSVAIKPSGQSLASWSGSTPPGELYLAGSPEQIAKFMQYADPRFVDAQPLLSDQWAKARPQADSKPVMGGRSAATRMRVKDDPAGGLYYSDYMPGGVHLSDVLVTLDASDGLDLYDVLDYLSEISGISLLIDPYAFDDPTGTKRKPLPPTSDTSGAREPGFRKASDFRGGGFRPGTVRGNFVNVPFDQFLQTILATHELVFSVQGGGGGSSDSGYGDASRGPGQGTASSGGDYQKPTILVTSPERLNYELNGTNDISMTQFHYADPNQVAQIMQQFNLVPDMNAGWYLYQGNGGSTGFGGGGGQGGGQGGGGNGGGQRGGGGQGGGRAAIAKPDVLVYRGNSRQPVEQAVQDALAKGQSVVRVALAPEHGGQLVTLFASGSKSH